MSKAINLLALAAGALLLASAPAQTVKLQESGKAAVGQIAPSFGGWDLFAVKGPLAFDKLLRTPQPAPLLVTFGASWCVPCNEGLPRLVALEKKHAGEFRLVLIDVEQDLGAGQAFATKCGVTGAAIHDKFEVIAKTYGLHDNGKLALPRTFLISGKGRVTAIYREEGKDLEEVIEADLKNALAAAEAPPPPPPAAPAK